MPVPSRDTDARYRVPFLVRTVITNSTSSAENIPSRHRLASVISFKDEWTEPMASGAFQSSHPSHDDGGADPRHKQIMSSCSGKPSIPPSLSYGSSSH